MIRHLSIGWDRFPLCDTQCYNTIQSATKRRTGINRSQGSCLDIPDAFDSPLLSFLHGSCYTSETPLRLLQNELGGLVESDSDACFYEECFCIAWCAWFSCFEGACLLSRFLFLVGLLVANTLAQGMPILCTMGTILALLKRAQSFRVVRPKRAENDITVATHGYLFHEI